MHFGVFIVIRYRVIISKNINGHLFTGNYKIT